MVTLCALLLLFSVRLQAQQTGKVYQLGFLSPATPQPSIPSALNLVPKLLQDSGYIEGRNLEVHRRFAEGKLERLPQLAKEWSICEWM